VFTHGRGVWAAALGTNPPDTSIGGGPTGLTNATTAAFTLAATPSAGATFQCKLDDGVFETCSANPSFSGLAEGDHTLQARAISAGGGDQSPALRTWTVDATSPDTSIPTKPAATTTDADAAFGFASTEPNSTFACALDGGSFATCAATPTFTVAGGAHTLAVRATDAAGNTDPTPATASWTYNAPQASTTPDPTVTPTVTVQAKPSVTPTPVATTLTPSLGAVTSISARKLLKGVKVSVGCTRVCTVELKLKLKSLTIATGKSTLPGGGTGSVKLKATKAGKRKLKRTKKGTLSLRAVFFGADGSAQTLTAKPKLKR
jgi:hypothetical protein